MSEVSSRQLEKPGASNIPTSDAIEAQLARIVKAERFAKSERLSAFLAFVVRQYLAGNTEQLKEYSIGMAVFGKTPDFDPGTNAIVRTTAARLRSELAKYYENEGKGDLILIELPKGHYIPQLTIRRSGNVEAIQVAAPTARSLQKWLWIAAGLLMLAVSAGLWLARSSHRPLTVSPPKDTRARRLFSRATSEGRMPSRIDTAYACGQLLITPDGKKLYAISYDRPSVTVVGVEDLQVKRTFDLPLPPDRSFMLANGKRIYISSHTPEQGVMVVDTGSDQVVDMIPTGAPVFGLAVTPDEKKLFLAMGYAGLKRIDLTTHLSRILSALAAPMGLALDPAGRRLYVSYQHSGPGGRPGHDAVDVYDVETERSVGVIKDLPMVGLQPIVSRSGDLALFDGGDACTSPAYDHVGCPPPILPANRHVVHLWHVGNRQLIASIQIEGQAAFFPQGCRLIFTGGELIVWDWARQRIVEKMNLPGVTFWKVAFTPDGDRAFVSTEAGGLIVFDAEKEECLTPAHGLANLYSGDGTLDDSQGVGSLTSLSPPQFSPGRVGQAFRFNGKDNFLRATTGSGFCPFCEYEWTESLFVKRESTTGEMTFLERVPTNSTTARRLYKSEDNHIVLQGSDGPNSAVSISSVGPVEAGRWYHLAVVTEKHRISLYIDGILQGQASIKHPFVGGERAPIFLGASQGKRNFLKGLIDEVAVYNRALSPAELKAMAGTCNAPW